MSKPIKCRQHVLNTIQFAKNKEGRVERVVLDHSDGSLTTELHFPIDSYTSQLDEKEMKDHAREEASKLGTRIDHSLGSTEQGKNGAWFQNVFFKVKIPEQVVDSKAIERELKKHAGIASVLELIEKETRKETKPPKVEKPPSLWDRVKGFFGSGK